MTAIFIGNLTAAVLLIALLIAICRGGFLAASDHPNGEALAPQPSSTARAPWRWRGLAARSSSSQRYR
jgi:hypothetical protein